MVENVIGQYNCKVNKKYVNIQFAKRLQVHIQFIQSAKRKTQLLQRTPWKGSFRGCPYMEKKSKED